ncbi:sugar transferase [Dyadobacter psychrotolerans]|uniref:Sugar transferase n=1 Tax=Dyadobacter psychrotolerans TaxID=2541721 RepID=A0A4R5DGT5_9BACT|nr:sugar transferase [Dyadobacter psychrotolerans]TDE12427.1 sugar transferase [Dyadobacter psychrotolerans]
MYKPAGKRILDLVLAGSGLIILSPLFLLLTLLLCFVNKGKPFFYQHRPGLNGKLFKLIKFRTMADERDASSSDSERITEVGHWLRRQSLDEIPQLLNVLSGKMSLVGPRPLLKEYLPLYNSFQFQRHQVKPGVTGWAQVNGRNAISWEKKFELDVWYVHNVSLRLDIKILFLTFKKLIFRTTTIKRETSIPDKFTGSSKI